MRIKSAELRVQLETRRPRIQPAQRPLDPPDEDALHRPRQHQSSETQTSMEATHIDCAVENAREEDVVLTEEGPKRDPDGDVVQNKPHGVEEATRNQLRPRGVTPGTHFVYRAA